MYDNRLMRARNITKKVRYNVFRMLEVEVVNPN